jgi:hypothetical protein
VLLTEHLMSARAHPAPATTCFAIHRPDSPGRPAVEAFIRAVYALHYGANIQSWAPTLVSLADGHDIVAAAGYRASERHPRSAPLFLERYLDRPVEAAIRAATGATVARNEVVEIGHFSSARAGGGRRLMVELGRHLVAGGFRWAVSTATQELRSIFTRMRITPVTLGAADPRVLGDQAASWGTYYEHAPMVLAGEILPNLPRIDRADAA